MNPIVPLGVASNELLNKQNRDFRRGKDALGDRAKKDVGKSATSFCAEDDEIEPAGFCTAYDF